MKAALFDLDGVLVNTEPLYSQFWGEMGKKYDLPYDDFADRIKGTTLPQILDTYFAPELHQEITAAVEAHDANMEFPLFPGAIEFLTQLNQRGIPCAVVTSSGADKMEHLWQSHPGMRELFSAVVIDSDVTHSKPDPEPFLVAAKKLGVDPKDCWIFEDSFNGLLSARRAGGFVVGLATTNPLHELEYKADVVIDSLSDLLGNDEIFG
ncbi:MAG: HAD family phosphatase [Bacteroidales bacterium]|nr:HAD family phosphatase [Bacteroidales bacterium]